MTTAELKMAQRGIITIPKTLRETYGLEAGDTFTLIDLEDGVFVLSRQRSDIDQVANRIRDQLTAEGETLASMLQALREERDKRAE